MADCGLGIIHWCQFDWQSFSTLATGLAAVIAAGWIGNKQVKISQKQTEILDKQVKLEEAALRSELFEKRISTYRAAVDFVMHIEDIPDGDKKAEKRIRLFAEKMQESQFSSLTPTCTKSYASFGTKVMPLDTMSPWKEANSKVNSSLIPNDNSAF